MAVEYVDGALGDAWPTGLGTMKPAMAESSTEHVDRLVLHDALDDAGKAWLQEIVEAFNRGHYTQAAHAVDADEAAAPGAIDE